MDVTLGISELKRSAMMARDVVPPMGQDSAYMGIYMEAKAGILTVCATDSKIYFRQVLGRAQGVRVEKEGRVLVPAHVFVDTLLVLSGTDCRLKTDEKGNLFMSSSALYGSEGSMEQQRQFQVLDLAGFPDESFFELPSFSAVEFSSEALHTAMSKVSFAASRQNLRPVLSGMYINVDNGKLVAACTDGRRIAEYESEVTYKGEPWNCVLEPKFVSKATKLLGDKELMEQQLFIAKDDTRMYLALDTIVLIGRLIDEEFPEYRSKLPNYQNKLLVSKDMLYEAVRGVIPLIRSFSDNNRIHISVSNRVMNLYGLDKTSKNMNKGIPVEGYDGKLELPISGMFVIEAVKRIKTDKVVLEFVDGETPISLSGEGDDSYTILIVPLKV